MPLSKPPSCAGCPLHSQSGSSYCPDEVRPGAKLFIMAQNPGEEEIAQGKPKVGRAGQYQERVFFPKTGLKREEMSLGNVIRCRWRNTNDLPPVESVLFREAAAHCRQAYGHIPAGTRLVLAEGDYAASVCTGEKVGGDPADSWRGYLRPFVGTPEHGQEYETIWHPTKGSLPVLVTQHTAFLFRSPEWAPVLLRDWGKVARYLVGTWPRTPPPFRFDPPDVMPTVFSFDTEFGVGESRGSTILKRWSAATQGQVWVVEASHGAVPQILPGSEVITQNALADIEHLSTVFESSEVKIQDTMLAHAVLFSDLPHSLNFLGSLYSSMNRWKHLGYSVDFQSEGAAPILYSGADAWGTWEVWQVLKAEFARDPQSWDVYQKVTLPLVSIIFKAQKKGLRVHQARLLEVMNALSQTAADAQSLGQASVGFPLNLASPAQVGDYLYRVLGIKPRRKP